MSASCLNPRAIPHTRCTYALGALIQVLPFTVRSTHLQRVHGRNPAVVDAPRLRADALKFWYPVGLRFQGPAYNGERRGAEFPTSGGSPPLCASRDRQHLGATPTPDTPR
ncbi:unnamed protein product [Ectocarpus sp. CCAP 1310/34]|nr:unnamed protein product [Ectocarpus sp. CCAP 1310/34]